MQCAKQVGHNQRLCNGGKEALVGFDQLINFVFFLSKSGTGMFLNWENLSPPEFKTFTQVLLSWSGCSPMS